MTETMKDEILSDSERFETEPDATENRPTEQSVAEETVNENEADAIVDSSEAEMPTTEQVPLNEPVKEEAQVSAAEPEKRSNRFSLTLKPLHLVIVGCAVVALVVGSLFLGMQLSSQSGIDKGAVNYPWKPSSGSVGTEKGIAIPGYESITLPSGVTDVDLILPNPSDNPCNFWFTLILADTGEELYRSGMIPPSMAVKKVTLSRALEAGDYTLIISIRTTSVTDGVPMNGATLSVPLRVR